MKRAWIVYTLLVASPALAKPGDSQSFGEKDWGRSIR